MEEKKLNCYRIFFSCEEEWADQAYFWAEDQNGAVRQLRLLWPQASIKSIEPEEEGYATKEQERRVVERIEELVKLLNPMNPEESFVGAAMRGVLDMARNNIEQDRMDSMQERMEDAVQVAEKMKENRTKLAYKLAETREERDKLQAQVDKQGGASAGPMLLSGCTIGTLVLHRREEAR